MVQMVIRLETDLFLLEILGEVEPPHPLAQHIFSIMELMLFTNKVELAIEGYNAGIDRVVIDLERRGKTERQNGYHLEINDHTIEDIVLIKSAVPITVLCRSNSFYKGIREEIEQIIAAGADVIMLPMFRTYREVEQFLYFVGGRARTSLLFETRQAVETAHLIRQLEFDEVYVGLNDLRISYELEFSYQLLAEGIIDQVRENFPRVDFGFGGITILDYGQPLATRDIIKELARLKSTQVIVRRAFKRDIEGRNMNIEGNRLKRYFELCLSYSESEVAFHHKAVKQQIEDIIEEINLVL